MPSSGLRSDLMQDSHLPRASELPHLDDAMNVTTRRGARTARAGGSGRGTVARVAQKQVGA